MWACKSGHLPVFSDLMNSINCNDNQRKVLWIPLFLCRPCLFVVKDLRLCLRSRGWACPPGRTSWWCSTPRTAETWWCACRGWCRPTRAASESWWAPCSATSRGEHPTRGGHSSSLIPPSLGRCRHAAVLVLAKNDPFFPPFLELPCFFVCGWLKCLCINLSMPTLP